MLMWAWPGNPISIRDNIICALGINDPLPYRVNPRGLLSYRSVASRSKDLLLPGSLADKDVLATLDRVRQEVEVHEGSKKKVTGAFEKMEHR